MLSLINHFKARSFLENHRKWLFCVKRDRKCYAFAVAFVAGIVIFFVAIFLHALTVFIMLVVVERGKSESLGHGKWLRYTGRFNKKVIKLLLQSKLFDFNQQVFPKGATNTSTKQKNNLWSLMWCCFLLKNFPVEKYLKSFNFWYIYSLQKCTIEGFEILLGQKFYQLMMHDLSLETVQMALWRVIESIVTFRF